MQLPISCPRVSYRERLFQVRVFVVFFIHSTYILCKERKSIKLGKYCFFEFHLNFYYYYYYYYYYY